MKALGRERLGSMGNIEELIGKGKGSREIWRGEEEIEDIFKRNKRTQRTPEKLGMRREDMEKMFRKLGENMRKVIESEIQKMGERMEEGREELRNQIKEMKESWEKERRMLRGRLEELQRKMERLERGKKEKEKNEMDGVRGGERERNMEKKLREMMIKIDKKEKEERRVNVIVKV